MPNAHGRCRTGWPERFTEKQPKISASFTQLYLPHLSAQWTASPAADRSSHEEQAVVEDVDEDEDEEGEEEDDDDDDGQPGGSGGDAGDDANASVNDKEETDATRGDQLSPAQQFMRGNTYPGTGYIFEPYEDFNETVEEFCGDIGAQDLDDMNRNTLINDFSESGKRRRYEGPLSAKQSYIKIDAPRFSTAEGTASHSTEPDVAQRRVYIVNPTAHNAVSLILTTTVNEVWAMRWLLYHHLKTFSACTVRFEKLEAICEVSTYDQLS
jgi:hypothetical protein